MSPKRYLGGLFHLPFLMCSAANCFGRMDMERTLESYFQDWESHVIGCGYGSGEPHTVAALKGFLGAMGDSRGPYCYDFEVLERAVTPTVTWLLMSMFVRNNLICYGTSPRYGWLTPCGERLHKFVTGRTNEQLLDILFARTEDSFYCSPGSCNCGERGYEEGRICQNPFWLEKLAAA